MMDRAAGEEQQPASRGAGLAGAMASQDAGRPGAQLVCLVYEVDGVGRLCR